MALHKDLPDSPHEILNFKDITTGEVTHTTILDTAGIADYRSVIGYFAPWYRAPPRRSAAARLRRLGHEWT